MTRSKAVTARYSLVNPHDDYCFEAPDDEVADAVCLLLGGGWYSWSKGDESGVLVGGLDEESRLAHVEGFEETIESRRSEVIACLRSFEIDPDGRLAAGADPDDWHELRRSSVADVRGSARETARALEASDG